MFQAIDIIISITLAIIMFSIGSSLTIKDFKRITKRPREISIGIILQILLLPLLAFIIIELFHNMPVESKIGIIILASCPGGSTSNFISYLVRADVALSISLTAVNSIITLISIPFFVGIALKLYMQKIVNMQLPIGSTIFSIIIIVIVPTILGILVHKKWKKLIDKSRVYIKIISIILLTFIFSIKFFGNTNIGGSGLNKETIIMLLPPLLLLHISSLFIGYFISRRAKLNKKSAATIGMEVGLQNTTLAILIGGTLLQNEAMVSAVLVYAMFSFFTTTGFGLLMLREKKQSTK